MPDFEVTRLTEEGAYVDLSVPGAALIRGPTLVRGNTVFKNKTLDLVVDLLEFLHSHE